MVKESWRKLLKLGVVTMVFPAHGRPFLVSVIEPSLTAG